MEDVQYVGEVIAIIIAIASIISMAVPDEHLGPFAGLINKLAANFHKAKNDPNA